MFTFFMKPRSLALLASLATLVLAPPAVLAQFGPPGWGINPYFQVRRGLSIRQAAYNTALMGQAYSAVPPYAMGYNPYQGGGVPAISPAVSPYAAALYSSPYAAGGSPYTAALTSSPYGGYDPSTSPYSGYGESPLGGFLRGTADVINSEGRVLVSIQQASLMREQVRRERLENRRRAFDLYLYERERTPTPEDERQRTQKELLRRSLNDPPTGEIMSAGALNTLLIDLQKKGNNLQGPNIALDSNVLQQINVKSPLGNGNPGLLKNEGKLTLPLVLRGDQYKEERDILIENTIKAYDQAVAHKMDSAALNALSASVRRLQEKLRDNIKDLTQREYSEGRRFLSDYEDALSLLRQPNAGDYLTKKGPTGKTVQDLVQHMTKNGLVFAPAVPGDEAAYLAVHRALAAFAAGVNAQVVTEKPAEKEK